jgi:hypothetical protein
MVCVGCTSTTESDATAAQSATTAAPTPAPTTTEAPTTSTTTTTQASTTSTAPTTSTTTTSSTTTTPSRQVVELEIRSRESWGAKAPDHALETHVIETITIHHTARARDDTPMEEKLQRWQDYHQSIGFGDIAYHMVIDADGTIYEGREYGFVGSTRTSYDPTGHFLPSLDGMFDEFWDNPNDDDDEPDGADDLSEAQLGALIDLLAWASVEFSVDPAEITGHRDHAATACPGSLVHEMLQSGEIAQLVSQRVEDVDIELVYVSE